MDSIGNVQETAGNEGQPELKLHIQLLLTGLEQYRRYPPMLLTAVSVGGSGMMLIAAIISGTLIAFVRYPTTFVAETALSIGVCSVIVIGAITAWQSLRLKEYQRTLPERIERAGLFERLAAGSACLPDIHSYTLSPWHVLLGSPPRTLEQQARLLANNLEWYLLTEPRRYFKRVWMLFCCCAVLAIGLAVTAEFMFPRAMFYGQPSVWLDPHFSAFTLVLAVILAPDWLAGFDFARRRIAAGTLASMIRDRYGIE